LEFVYNKLVKYTSLESTEILFIANDADQDVIDYLARNYIPHFVFNNSDIHRKEWYVNNVYRAYNYASEVASGDFLIFVNSDMAFSPGWLEELVASYDGKSVLSPLTVESGKYDAAENCISRNFGRTFLDYEENEFLTFSDKVREDLTKVGGIFMPLFIKKSFFENAFLSITRTPSLYLYFLILRILLDSCLNASASSAVAPPPPPPPLIGAAPRTGIACAAPMVATAAVLTTDTATTVRRSPTSIFEFNETYLSN